MRACVIVGTGISREGSASAIDSSKKIWEWTAPNVVQAREARREPPGDGQVEVRIAAIGICGTDLHIMSGQTNFGLPPLPLGHELAGTVERVGGQIAGWTAGDRVCIDPLIGCGVCRACHSGNKHLCPDAGEIGLHFPGGWQQFLTVPASNLYRIPDNVGFEEATQAETIHCCLGGIDKLDIRAGKRAVVMGDGPTALFFVQLLQAAGAGPVTLVGMQEHRLRLGGTLGADKCIRLGSSDDILLSALRDSQDIAIDAAGSAASLDACIRSLAIGGQLLLFGLPGRPIPVDVQTIVMKELTLYGSTNAPKVWPRVIALLAEGKIDAKAAITHRFAFDELDKALELARAPAGDAVKIIVRV